MLETPGHVDRVADTRLRFGTQDDIPAIARLMARSHAIDGIPRIDRQELEAIADRGQLIVLQVEADELAAAACVATGRGLIFLTIDPEVATTELEHRMIGVAEALCESERGRRHCATKQTSFHGRR
jgi:hypothetical protein